MDFEEKLYHVVGDRLRRAEPLSCHTTFRIGGPADYYAAPSNVSELRETVLLCRQERVPYLVIGNGSNLLCADAGFHGLIIDTTKGLTRCQVEETVIRAEAGLLLGSLAKQAMAAGLSGLEFAAGIPGSVGGAITMNAGAYGGEMKQVISWVKVLTPDGAVITVPAKEMDFSYRHSAVDSRKWIVLEACFSLKRGEPEAIQAVMDDLAGRRREKQPLEYPSAGSTFKRPLNGYAAQLIDEAGLKGLTVGGAQVSEKHAGFVINRAGASAADVLALCQKVQETVKQSGGVELELEVRVIGEP